MLPWLTATRANEMPTAVAESAAEEVVALKHLSIKLAGKLILDRIDLAIRQGEIIALLGANGSGKTTLLKCLAGLVRPAAGDVRYRSQVGPHSRHWRRQIGFAGHEFGLYLELTPQENLTFAARMHGVKDTDRRAEHWLHEIQFGPRTVQPTARLSQGMRQRLAIARAMIHDPMLVLLDEPFASLDVESRAWLQTRLVQWRQQGRAICITSHDRDHAAALADRLIQIRNRRVTELDVKELDHQEQNYKANRPSSFVNRRSA